MRGNDGRKLDHKTLEVLRMRAIEQVAAGAHPEEIAVMLGFHKNTVYGWLAKAREGGKDALKAKAVPGRPPRLSPTQISRLYGFIVGMDPRQLSFEFALWTRDMVREVAVSWSEHSNRTRWRRPGRRWSHTAGRPHSQQYPPCAGIRCTPVLR